MDLLTVNVDKMGKCKLTIHPISTMVELNIIDSKYFDKYVYSRAIHESNRNDVHSIFV
jgi:hypothetical protein